MKYRILFACVYLASTVLSCDSEKLLPEVRLHPPKIEYSLFKKNTMILKWGIRKTKEEILGYRISYKATENEQAGQRLVSAKALGHNYELTGLVEGIPYKIKIQAVYDTYSGEWSKAVEGVTGKPETVQGFTLKKKTGF